MLITICDRCKEKIEGKPNLVKFEAKMGGNFTKELCDTCYEHIRAEVTK